MPAKNELTDTEFKELAALMKRASHAQQMNLLRYTMKESAVKSFMKERGTVTGPEVFRLKDAG